MLLKLLLNIYRYDQVILKPSPKNLFLIHLTEIFGFICQFLQTVTENPKKKQKPNQKPGIKIFNQATGIQGLFHCPNCYVQL